MARTDIAAQQISRLGITPAFATPNVAGNMFLNDGKTVLEVKNGSASSINVTPNVAATVDGQAVTNPVIAVTATTGDKIIGPFPPGIYNQTDGKVYVDFSAITTVTIAVYQLP
jgi:hypothetical protein